MGGCIQKRQRHLQITDMSRFHFLSQRGAFVQMSTHTLTGSFSPRRYRGGGTRGPVGEDSIVQTGLDWELPGGGPCWLHLSTQRVCAKAPPPTPDLLRLSRQHLSRQHLCDLSVQFRGRRHWSAEKRGKKKKKKPQGPRVFSTEGVRGEPRLYTWQWAESDSSESNSQPTS